MIYLPSSRLPVLVAITILVILLTWRLRLSVTKSLPHVVLHQPLPPSLGIHVPTASLEPQLWAGIGASEGQLSLPADSLNAWDKISDRRSTNDTSRNSWSPPIPQLHLDMLWQCPKQPNKYTNHIRLSNIIQNITLIPLNSTVVETRSFWNPSIISLPNWSTNKYLVVSRIVTNGNHQQNVICEANVCYTGSPEDARSGESPCTKDEIRHLGPAGGMRCSTKPLVLNVPPTPAKLCDGIFRTYVDIPGFHDPRIFYSGRGEPLMIANTQSRYACFGLWIIDLRSLYSPLSLYLSSSPHQPSLGPLNSYPTLTELTRNPPLTRTAIEKNWMMFYPESGETFVHYDVYNPQTTSPGRTFAKVLGGGLTTTNLTDPFEFPCITDHNAHKTRQSKTSGKWHQATNSLRLALCNRSEKNCEAKPENTVFFAIIHRKHINALRLPLRYERYLITWAATPPFSMLSISQHPVLLANETASGWRMWENWDDDPSNARIVQEHKARHGPSSTDPHGGKQFWAHFTYTVSIAWAWGRGQLELSEMNLGFWDDEVVLSIGIDDLGQGMSRVKVSDLLQCMRACPLRTR